MTLRRNFRVVEALHVKEAPKLGENTNEEITAFIDKSISYRIPPDHEDEELHQLVTQLQKHYNSGTCKKRILYADFISQSLLVQKH